MFANCNGVTIYSSGIVYLVNVYSSIHYIKFLIVIDLYRLQSKDYVHNTDRTINHLKKIYLFCLTSSDERFLRVDKVRNRLSPSGTTSVSYTHLHIQLPVIS